jgi:hypothetical protein
MPYFPHLLVQPRFGERQISAHGPGRYLENLRNLINRQAAEIAQLHRRRLPSIHLLQCLQALVESHQVGAPSIWQVDRLFERNSAAVAFRGLAATRMVHQNLAHWLRCNRKEMRAALTGRGLLLLEQPNVRLVNQRGWLQRVVRAFFSQVTGGQPPQFRVYTPRQIVESLPISTRPLAQQRCYFVALRHSPIPCLWGLPLVLARISPKGWLFPGPEFT